MVTDVNTTRHGRVDSVGGVARLCRSCQRCRTGGIISGSTVTVESVRGHYRGQPRTPVVSAVSSCRDALTECERRQSTTIYIYTYIYIYIHLSIYIHTYVYNDELRKCVRV